MRVSVFCLMALLPATELAHAQSKAAIKPPTPGIETRYFTSIDGFMDGNADVILKETRQGKNVTAAVLDVCYPAAKGSDRKDRFVANLAVNGPTLSGATQSLGDKAPVTVKLQRNPTGETFEFKGQIGIGPNIIDVASTDNSDVSEQEFKDTLSIDDSIATDPKDFTEVSPEAVAVRVKLETAADFLKSLKGQRLQVSLGSLNVSCEALRSGEQLITIHTDPERAPGLIAKAKATPGVVAAGWTSGIVDMERALRFPALDWRDGEKLNRDRIATAIAAVLARTIGARPAATIWNDDTGKLKLTFKRQSAAFPALELTETVEFTALVAPDKPGATDRLMLWISNPAVSTADESAGPKLALAEPLGGEEETYQRDESGALEALAREFKAQRWDADKSAWK